MKYPFVALLLVLVAPLTLSAEERIYFQVLSGEETVSFTNQAVSGVHPVLKDVALRTFTKPFSPELVKSDYYQLTVNRGIVWNGENLIQYDYMPLMKDRFRNVFWFTADGSGLVKSEIYDNDGRLLFSATCMTNNMPVVPASSFVQLSMDESPLKFFGFANVYTESASDGTFRMTFTDGLNRFSLFRSLVKPKALKEQEKMVMYGNYVFNKIHGDYKYTVVGTIPYYKMEEVVVKAITLYDDESFRHTVESRPESMQTTELN